MSQAAKKKTIVPKRTPMPELEPDVRRRTFNEVPLGYTLDLAMQEAQRCLECKAAPCQAGCPVGVGIRDFIHAIAEGRIVDAATKVREKNALPAVCGRVCPQESQCEGHCTLGKKFEPVAIGRLERFVADYERLSGTAQLPPKAPPTRKRVAVIGSGPAGLTVAGDLARRGHAVTVLEAFHKPGGVLMYGIPEFRLPKEVVEQEVEGLVQMGVDLQLNTVVGQSITVEELLLRQGFDAAFIGVGAGLPMRLNVSGEDLGRIYTATEYLSRANLMRANFPQHDAPAVRGPHVCVVGGGNVAMDAARTALRLGADEVKIVYRRFARRVSSVRGRSTLCRTRRCGFRTAGKPDRLRWRRSGQRRADLLRTDGIGRAGRTRAAAGRGPCRTHTSRSKRTSSSWPSAWARILSSQTARPIWL